MAEGVERMKKISVIIPCYNEEKSVHEMTVRLKTVFSNLAGYDYEIIFVDDCSPDGTWEKICTECAEDRKIKGVHNITNFGPTRNIFQSLSYGDGDAFFLLMGDLQQPPEFLPEFLKYWEEGYKAVSGIHENTEDRGLMAFGRKMYYRLMSALSGHRTFPNSTGYGLYDRSIIQSIRQIRNVQPYLPGLLAEYSGKIKTIPVEQAASRRGRSNQNFFRKYDYAMVGLTSYTKILMRVSTFIGCMVGLISFIFSAVVLIMKLTHWDTYPMGIPSILIGIFFLGAVQLFFLGIMGEYILSINERSMDRPVTVTDRMVNFGEEEV